MKKITTLFKKNPEDLGRVINELNPENTWVLENGIATRKFDGTSCAIFQGELFKRYDARINKKTGNYKKPIPENAIPCQEADFKSGHHPHWIACDRNNKADQYHFQAFDLLENKIDGTYELCGEKVQSNPENIIGHQLIKHGSEVLEIHDLSYEGIQEFLSQNDIEGIVFINPETEDMCKIRQSDFGLKRKEKEVLI
ncbi:hypothetical protein [Aureivirga sp. CE67]|uniref:hypothetical protein n=1 Tax=Aureivirga sp. CE67 TaxID=1788983 RepID=UPI0018CAC5FB|nr:hypothetical protein [Aureivirga sp. CE67]